MRAKKQKQITFTAHLFDFAASCLTFRTAHPRKKSKTTADRQAGTVFGIKREAGDKNFSLCQTFPVNELRRVELTLFKKTTFCFVFFSFPSTSCMTAVRPSLQATVEHCWIFFFHDARLVHNEGSAGESFPPFLRSPKRKHAGTLSKPDALWENPAAA